MLTSVQIVLVDLDLRACHQKTLTLANMLLTHQFRYKHVQYGELRLFTSKYKGNSLAQLLQNT